MGTGAVDAPAVALAPVGRPTGAAFYPALFVVMWSTGFIAAKYGLPYAPPLTFLLLRFVCVAVLMTAVALLARVAWTSWQQAVHVALAGLLVHGTYLAGVWISLNEGMDAGTSAMLVGLQPLLTVFLARLWLSERVLPRQWTGLLLGLVGVYCVVRHKLGLTGGESLLPSLVALAGISVGTIYQKRRCANVDLRSGAAIQFSACALVFLPLALLFETATVQWTSPFVFALAWSVMVLSVGAINLLYWLLRHGAATDVARLFYLVPPVTALMAYLFFGERLDALALIGMALIAAGVALARPRALKKSR